MTRTIAIIEDNIDHMELLQKPLKEVGYEVYGAVSDFGIIKKMGMKKPDLIILDLKLGLLSGEDVVDALRKKDFIDGIPIIIISLKEENEIRKAVEEMGAAAWASKPVTNENLLKLVKKHIK